MEEQIKRLKELAMKNYQNGGDFVVECWDRRTFVEFIEEHGADSERKLLILIGVLAERNRDIEAEIF